MLTQELALHAHTFANHTAAVRAAYASCQGLEASDKVEARILAYLMLFLDLDAREAKALAPHALDTFAAEIVACETREQLVRLARQYLDGLIRPFYRLQKPYPQPEPTDGYEAVQKLALERDNFCCVLTGRPDFPSKPKGLVSDPDICATSTLAARIVPERVDANIARTLLGRALCPKMLRYDLDNVLTMDLDHHDKFYKLYNWIEPTADIQHASPVAHTYRPCALHSALMIHLPDIITLTRSPNRAYLALHAFVCHVAHASGATAYIDVFP